MPINDGLIKATDFNLDQLSIVGASGTAVDIREILYELNLNEDLFGNTMSGSLMLNDTQNLINLLPILGMEFLLVSLTKPSTPYKIQKVFRIYKISDRKKLSASSETYILHFCSEESIISESLKISKSYKGQTVSQIVKDICTTYLKIDRNKLKTSAITDTQGTFDIVVPYWSPFYTINWLARMAKTSRSASCSFVFFEDSEGYHFTPLEQLIQEQPLQSINFNPMHVINQQDEANRKSDMLVRHESASGYELLGSPDMLASFGLGTYAGRLTSIDPFSQKISVNNVNTSVLFAQTKHLNTHSYIQTNPDRTKKTITDHSEAFFRVSASNLKVETWLLQRNAYISAMHGFRIKVELPGSMYLKVGQVVTLNLPASQIASQEQKVLDDLYSGNYLITAIRHKVDRTKYTVTMELSKDSVKDPLAQPVSSTPALVRLREL